jgi:formamidopyrimidine-DNA glycosylase
VEKVRTWKIENLTREISRSGEEASAEEALLSDFHVPTFSPSHFSTSPLMPELPDITVYLEALERRMLGRRLERVQLADVFVLRTAIPPIDSLAGKRVVELRRIGKRIVFGFEGGCWLVIHLMIAGRLQWADGTSKPGGRNVLATFRFENGTLTLTEAGTKHRAALHVVADEAALRRHDPGGIDMMTCSLEEFAAALTRENHTLKRSLTDPHLFSGIGNAYSDEILHTARLSPVALTQKLSAAEIARLLGATREELRAWTDRLRREAGDAFPGKVTAFRPEMAVHGKFGKPCPVCGTAVQRIVYAENEVNYCPRCQTGGKLLADRSLSRLLKSDWPRTIEEAERRRAVL